MKTLLMLLVALGVWWLLRGLFRDRVSGEAPHQDEVAAPPSAPQAELFPKETIVACTFCQLHLPRSEAVWLGEKAFCGHAHLQAHEASGESHSQQP
jgi:ABC-type nickel/cobalt efflux system permease component RcnA